MSRHGVGHVRHLVGKLRARELSTLEVADELGLSARRVRQLYTNYLSSCAQGQEDQWEPRKSGGNRERSIPERVEDLWKRMLRATPPAPYAFAASEALRLHTFMTDRATVRRWAIHAGLAHSVPRKKRSSAAVRRWQCAEVGALWQLDSTPHRWFGDEDDFFPLLDMVDDCSRVMVGSRLYPRECLLAYMDFLPRSFQEYGFPLALYVDYHSFFFSKIPDNLTYLGQALHRYDISLKFAPTPQAKGKIERQHQFWQNRLPSFFSANRMTDIQAANPHIDKLRRHHNTEEIHREIEMTPDFAWRKAKKDGRIVLRPFHVDPWWKYIWSVRQRVRVGMDGLISIDGTKVRLSSRCNSWALQCDHPDGTVSFLANEPGSGGNPILLFVYKRSKPFWTI